MNPSNYIPDSFELSPQLLIKELQNTLYSMTNEFLNGYLFTKPSKLFYPFMKRLSSPPAFERLEYIAMLLAKLPDTNKEVNSARTLINNLCNMRLQPSNLAAGISKLYELLQLYIDRFATISTGQYTTVTAARKFNPADYQTERLKPIVKLHRFVNDKLNQYAQGFYLHGSVSTLDFCNYSDVDTLCIVTKKAISDPARLVALQKQIIAMHRYFYEFDFLQHHGVFIITEYDLEYYPQTYFPLILFDYSTAIFQQSPELQFKTRDSRSDQVNCFCRHVDSIKRTYLEKAFPKNLCAFKQYLSTFMLLPVLYLEAKDTYCYKRSSFEICKDEFEPDAWAAMDQATAIRDRWSFTTPLLYRCLSKFRANPMLGTKVYSNLVRSLPKHFNNLANEEFYRQCSVLSELMLKNIRQMIQEGCTT